jgi:ParB family chromosome partitioning protein
MTDITSIPPHKPVAWDGNVRKTAGADSTVHELASSIAAHGLINNLVVRPHRKDTYAVVTGGRRLAALQLLAKNGTLPTEEKSLNYRLNA